MFLGNNDVQKIVDRVVNILGKNINIMNKDGIIIGSGDESRINTYHEAAKIAASEKREIIINDNNRNLYKGSKPGVNIPIYHNNKVIGVVGITGEKKSTQGYGQIVKELVELMIGENERKKVEAYQMRALEGFAKELIKKNSNEDLGIIKWRANLVNFDLLKTRRVIVCDIIDFKNRIKELEPTKKNPEIVIQKLKQKIIDTIQSNSDKQYDFVFNLYEDRFIILKSKTDNIIDYCKRVNDITFDRLKIRLYMGIGQECNEIQEYNKSFKMARKLVEIGSKVSSDKHIYTYHEYSLHLFYDNIDSAQREEFIKNYSNILDDLNSNTKEILRTVKVYFLMNMNIKDTANAMFIHRNTVIYRFNKLKEIHNIDITNSIECMKLYACIIAAELNGIL